MKKRLIDANALQQTMESNLYWGLDSDGAILDTIDEAPTVDAVEVVHGHWYFTEYEYFDCSVCGFVYYNGCECSSEAREKLQNGDAYRYCPHCGAKMDDGNL